MNKAVVVLRQTFYQYVPMYLSKAHIYIVIKV